MLRGLLWWTIGLSVLLIFLAGYGVVTGIDNALGWVEGKINAAFDARYGDW
jgi:hypothetical protein